MGVLIKDLLPLARTQRAHTVKTAFTSNGELVIIMCDTQDQPIAYGLFPGAKALQMMRETEKELLKFSKNRNSHLIIIPSEVTLK
jgi:hypothetical protein